MDLRPADAFVVAYPRSGTNWVGYFLATVLAEHRTGKGRRLDTDSFRDWVPDINSEYFDSGSLAAYEGLEDPRIFTVHAPFSVLLRRIVYLVRDPRDVMVSYYYYHRRVNPDYDRSLREFVARNSAWPGDWGDHVRGWLTRAAREDVLLVRYEDLKCDPVGRFGAIASFCGLPLDDQELRRYVERASFSSMSRVEPGRETSRFPLLRRGRVGDWRDRLDPKSVRRIERRYGRLMEELGYRTVT